MQKTLSQMTQSELASLVIPLIENHGCECCGSRDLSHDEKLCKQTAYAAFDQWRADEIAAGRWVDEIPAVEPVEVEPVSAKGRCPHYAEIRAFFALAREKGMDAKAVDRARGAMGVVLGRRIESRKDLTRDEWIQAHQALQAGFLAW